MQCESIEMIRMLHSKVTVHYLQLS